MFIVRSIVTSTSKTDRMRSPLRTGTDKVTDKRSAARKWRSSFSLLRPFNDTNLTIRHCRVGPGNFTPSPSQNSGLEPLVPVRGALPHQSYSYANRTANLGCPVLLMTQSEIKFQSKLHLTARHHCRSNYPEGPGAIVLEGVRLCERRMIESVEEFEAEFQVRTLRDIEHLSQRHVAGHGTRTLEAVLSRITERELGGINVAGGVNPICHRPLSSRQVAIAELIGAGHSDRASVGRIEANLRCEVETGVQGDDSTHMPSTEDQVCDTAGVEIRLAFADRELIIEARDPAHPLVEVG